LKRQRKTRIGLTATPSLHWPIDNCAGPAAERGCAFALVERAVTQGIEQFPRAVPVECVDDAGMFEIT